MSRIALVVPTFPRRSETFIVSKVLGLRERGWDVHVVCGSGEEGNWSTFPTLATDQDLRSRVHPTPRVAPRIIPVLTLPLVLLRTLAARPRGTVRYLSRGWRRFRLGVLKRFYLDSTLVRLDPDLIHFEFGALAVERLHLRDLLDVPVTVSFRGHDLNFVGLDESAYYDELWSAVDGVHVLGEDLWRRAVSRGAPEDLAHVLIPPALDTSRFTPRGPEPGGLGAVGRPLRLVGVARLYWTKGYEYALEAVALLRGSGLSVEYRIVGDGPYLEAVSFWRHQLGLDDCVEIIGGIPQDQVREQLGWADLLIHAAVSEGFCNAVMEAQASGLPVVCTDADGLRENVEDGVTGVVVPRRDASALADAVLALVEDPRRMAEMAGAGPARVSERFALDHQLDLIESFQRDVLGRAGAHRSTAGSES